MSLLLKAIAVIFLVGCSIAAPVEEQSQDVNVEIPAIDDSAPKGLQDILAEGEYALTRTKRQFGLGGNRRIFLKDWKDFEYIIYWYF